MSSTSQPFPPAWGEPEPAGAHPAPLRHRVSVWLLWFGLFGAPLAWSIQILVGYPFDAHGCFPKMRPLAAPSFAWLWGFQLVVGIVCFAISVAAGVVAWRAWHSTQEERGGGHERLLEVGEGRTRFMAFSGVLVSALFALGVVLNLIPIFLVPACGW
jgi:uncharacterized membrane protein YeiB